MYEVVKRVFYCSFCKRHRLTKASMEKHEAKCIRNPDRHCGWHESYLPPAVHIGTLAKKINFATSLEEIRTETHDCPACMLAAIVQSDLSTEEKWDLGFSYNEEIRAFRAQEREQERQHQW